MERTKFIGTIVPVEVKLLSKQLKQVDIEKFKTLLKVAVTFLTAKNPTSETFNEMTEGLEQSLIQKFYPGVLTILIRAMRVPLKKLKKVDFANDLKELSISESHIKLFVEVLYGDNRMELENATLKRRPRFSSVKQFQWRIDVSISTTSLKRVLEPTILCQIKTSNDEECTFEVTKEKFHELRYTVSQVLNHMQQLEKRSILNIQT